MESTRFNGVLLDISDQLGVHLQKMKFLCGKTIGKGRLEDIHTGYELFTVLMERNKLGPDNTEFLCELLTTLGREDLLEKVRDYEKATCATNAQPDKTELDKMDIATEVIRERLGKQWRRLGRKLHLTEVQLESITRKHRDDLEEQVMEMLKVWRRSRGAEARAQELVQALRACEQNLTADKVQERLDELAGGQ